MPETVPDGAWPSREPEAPWPETPRLCPQRPLPPYRFVPGLNPHPTESPAGHSREQRAYETVALVPERWRDNETYLYGIDLYHQGYFWEAHEAWEDLWRRTLRDTPEGLFLQGLILNSAAQLKARMGAGRGARSLSRSAEQRIARVLASGACENGRYYMGLNVVELLHRLRIHYRPLWEANGEATVRLDGRPPLLWPVGIEGR